MTEFDLVEWARFNVHRATPTDIEIILDMLVENGQISAAKTELEFELGNMYVELGWDFCGSRLESQYDDLMEALNHRLAEIDQRLELDAELKAQEEYAATMKADDR